MLRSISNIASSFHAPISLAGKLLAALGLRRTMPGARVETRYEQESEMSSNRRRLAFPMILAVAAVLLFLTPARAESTFDQIKRTGELRYGAIDYPPNWFRDKTTGKWQGFLVEVAEDVAKEMSVKAVPVETTWATCVLDLQANKTDVQFGLQATPKRALAIDFAGPVYNLYWYAINHKGFEAKNWGDYNKPEIKIAAMLGSADVTILQKVAPKATRVELNDVASVAPGDLAADVADHTAEPNAQNGFETRRIHVDKGYRGHNHAHKFRSSPPRSAARCAAVPRSSRSLATSRPSTGWAATTSKAATATVSTPCSPRLVTTSVCSCAGSSGFCAP